MKSIVSMQWFRHNDVFPRRSRKDTRVIFATRDFCNHSDLSYRCHLSRVQYLATRPDRVLVASVGKGDPP